METWDIEECLESMSVIVDTREQNSNRSEARYKGFGVPYNKQTLNYGDYTYNFKLPDGTLCYPSDITISPAVMIERKMNLEELSMCFCQSRKRFQAEFERAHKNNAAIYLIIEDGSWEKLIHHRYKTQFNEKSFTASMVAWMVRYNIKPVFCQHEISGQIIKEILYRELKERLERGEYG